MLGAVNPALLEGHKKHQHGAALLRSKHQSTAQQGPLAAQRGSVRLRLQADGQAEDATGPVMQLCQGRDAESGHGVISEGAEDDLRDVRGSRRGHGSIISVHSADAGPQSC